MSNILFVDDDKNVLSGLRRRIRSTCPDWNMSFAESGQEALSLCDAQAFDVVVTDMRMPGMDGAALLSAIKERNPDTARIILSGYSDDEAILRTVGPAQKYLAKPCDDEVLVGAIRKILEIRDIIDSPAIRNLIGNIDALASPPDTYMKLLETLDDPKAGTDKVEAIVAADIALTAEVLKLTNSAYFALPSKITSVSHAVRMLGTDTLKSLALFVGLFKSFEGPRIVGTRISTLCARSQQIGVAASLIAEQEHLDRATCKLLPAIGMLSHIGSLILYLHHYKEMEQVISEVEKEDYTIIEAEKHHFGAAHPEIGAYLLGLWGFPDSVVQAVAHHHTPARYPHSEMTGLSALYVAQHLTRELAQNPRKDGSEYVSEIDFDYLDRIGKRNRLDEWCNIVEKVLANDLNNKT